MMKGLMKFLGGLIGEALVDDLKDRVDETLEGAKLKVEQTVELVLKKVFSFLLIIIGFLFGLVGLGTYLSERVPALADGVGFILIGIVLLFLAWFARFMSK